MGVASLIDKCLQYGIPVDIANLTKESKGLTRDQVMELRLEQLLMARKLEIRTSEAQDFKNQLEEASKELEVKQNKITSQKNEIRKLKAEIQKMRGRDSGISGEPSESTQTDNEDCDTFDWGQGQVACTSGTGNDHFDDGGPQPTGSVFEEPARYHDFHRSQGIGGSQVTVNLLNLSASASGPADGNLPLFQRHSSADNVTDNRDDYEDTGSVSSEVQLDENGEEEDEERTQEHDGGSQMMVNLSASTSGSAERDLPVFKRHSNIENVTDNRNDYEDNESSEIQLDEDEEEEENSPQSYGSHSAQSLPPSDRRPSDAFDEMMDISSDMSSPPGPDSIFEQSGGSNVSNTAIATSFPCQRCPIQYKSYQGLQKHIFSVHSKDPGVFKCEKCRFGYFSERECRRHNDRHRKPNGQQWPCNYCSKILNSKSARYYHQQMHVGRNGEFQRAKCEICGKSFGSRYTLRNHQKKQHPQAN